MTQIGIMIEGSRGLNWARWKRLLRTAEDCGYQCVFRSDHFTNPAGEDDQDSLELWMSLAYAASHSKSHRVRLAGGARYLPPSQHAGALRRRH